MEPSLTALFSNATWQQLGDIGPFFRSILCHGFFENVIFLLRPLRPLAFLIWLQIARGRLDLLFENSCLSLKFVKTGLREVRLGNFFALQIGYLVFLYDLKNFPGIFCGKLTCSILTNCLRTTYELILLKSLIFRLRVLSLHMARRILS